MQDWAIGASVGAALVAVGVVMMRSHRTAWRRQKQDSTLDPAERTHLYARYRRRMQTSVLITVIGVLIPLGVVFFDPDNAGVPVLAATLFWIGVLILVLWVLLLGVGDLVAIRAHTRSSLGRLRQKQQELEHRLAELRRQQSHEGNGR